MSERYAVSPAVYVLLERENVQTGMTETLFMRRSGTGYMDGHWGLPAGHLDPGESLVTGASRELSEEAGVAVESSELDFVHVAHTAPETPGDHADQRIDFYFRARLPEGAEPVIMEPNKCDAIGWFTCDSYPEPLVPRVQQALKKISKEIVFSEVDW